MDNEESCDSDTSSELPDLYTKQAFEIDKLKQNEIVWAEYKGLHWPALVRQVDKKNRKVRVWYLDAPKKSFKLPYQKIHDFCDAEFNKEVYEKAKSNPMSKEHHEVCRRSLMFVFRRGRGHQDNPADFFDRSKPYFLLKEFNSVNMVSKLTSDEASTESIIDINDNLEGSSEGESVAESDEENSQTTRNVPELYKEDSPFDNEMEEKFLSFIKAGHVDDHLMNVWNSKIASEKHDLYLEALKTCNLKLLTDSPSYIPLCNREILHNINMYLCELYEQKIGKGKPKMTEYVVSVWLPEAVNKVISLLESKTWEEFVQFDNCDVSNLPLPTSELPVNSSNDSLSCLPNVAKTSELPIDQINKLSESLVPEVETMKAQSKSFKRRYPSGAPEPAMQALTDAVEGLEASVKNFRSSVVKEKKLNFASESSNSFDNSLSSDYPANENICGKKQKKNAKSVPERRTSLRLKLKK